MDNRFRKLLDFVLNSKNDFYRNKYKGLDIKEIDDIPYLTRDEIVAAGDFLFVDDDKVDAVNASKGTTGNSVIIYNDATEDDLEIEFPFGKKFGRTMLIGSTLRTHIIGIMWSKRGGLFHIAGDLNDLSGSLKLADKFGAETIRCSPRVAVALKRYLDEFPEFELKRFILGGELVTTDMWERIKSLYPDINIYNMYALSEAANVVGYQCDYLMKDRNLLLHPTDYHYLEDYNGELILTTLTSRASPVIRYRTGDKVEWFENNCPCGKSGKLFKPMGRI